MSLQTNHYCFNPFLIPKLHCSYQCNFELDDLQFYKHVGMRVQLHTVGNIGKWRLRRNLDVTYPLRHDWSSEIRRVFMNNIFANLTTLSGIKNNHKLTEYQKRLHFAMTYRRALGSGGMLQREVSIAKFKAFIILLTIAFVCQFFTLTRGETVSSHLMSIITSEQRLQVLASPKRFWIRRSPVRHTKIPPGHRGC